MQLALPSLGSNPVLRGRGRTSRLGLQTTSKPDSQIVSTTAAGNENSAADAVEGKTGEEDHQVDDILSSSSVKESLAVADKRDGCSFSAFGPYDTVNTQLMP